MAEVEVARNGAVQTITLNRPEVLNAFNRALHKALREALASDVVKKQLALDGTEITPGTPEDYADFIDKDEKKWAGLVKASGVEQE